jgi:UPF0755 protein
VKRVYRIVALLAVALVLLALVGAGWCWRQLHRPWAGWDGAEVVVELPRGMNAGAMLEELRRARVLQNPGLTRAWLVLRGAGGTLQAGEYRFHEPASPLAVLDRLSSGDVLLHPVTLPEGFVLEEIAERLAEAGIVEAEPMLAALEDPAPIRELAPDVDDLEGFLYPETYHFPRGESPERIVAAMVGRFVEQVGDGFAEEAAAAGLTLAEAVTLASLIEKETSVAAERPRISRVFHNRLARGMRLQCDPTVIYAHHREGRRIERLLSAHLELDSPWNTYRVHGLPPGPIGAPGKDSLLAAVRPVEGKELYFVAAPDGGHTFSESLAAHQRAVRVWRRYLRSSR